MAKIYKLPDFNLQRLLNHIQECINNAPHGIVPLVIDLFCGAGGTSEGIEQARAENGAKCFVTIAGINHDLKAICSQAKNHPLAYYSTEDIRTAKLDKIKAIIDACKERWPWLPIIVWASLECTNHSNAKGGMSRDADSRSLPEHIFRYLKALQPDGLWIENVKEFFEWGPMMVKVIMEKGKGSKTLAEPIREEEELEFYTKQMNEGVICKCPIIQKRPKKKTDPLLPAQPWNVPIKKLKGTYYLPWRNKVEKFGYHCQEWHFNAADFGVPQNRKRFFPIFMRKDMPITKPIPTHSEKGSSDIFNTILPHIPVKTCLDFSQEGESIFTPGKIKSDKSFERYYAGLIKFVAGGKSAFMQQRNSGTALSKIFSVDGPARTVTTTGGNQELVQTYFLAKHFSSHNNTQQNAGSSIHEPAPTVTTFANTSLVEAEFITKFMSNNAKTGINSGSSVNAPAPTVTTQQRLALTQAQFLDVIYGNGTPSGLNKPSPTVRTKDGLSLVSPMFITNYQGQSTANSLDEPSPSVMTKDKLALTSIKYFICNQYTSGGQLNDINDPAAAVTTNPKSNVVGVEPWILSPHFGNIGTSIDEPSATITANRKHHYLVNPAWFNEGATDINNPSPTIVARQDKSPISLASAESGVVFAIPVFETDSEIVIKIKEFMVLYGIADIKTRMLMVTELLKIQSFPNGYHLEGTETDKKKFIGNAVPPLVAKKIAEAMYGGMVRYIVKKYKMAA